MEEFFNSEPSYWGPGVWFSIHVAAYNAIDKHTTDCFINLVDVLSKTIPCEKCREHFQDFVKKNPPRNAQPETRGGRDVTMFRWAFSLHNKANAYTNKPVVGFGTAYDYFSGIEKKGLCKLGDCGKKKETRKKSLTEMLVSSRR